ncbi:uncharacterized protein I303_107027 [Kwoniella dejecticola CBS 10117]|uniref:Uncharacterized protein n=1 Tax=Kwoniella dejecticola CBS 10117 TaxID=1296121 RepID=A0A1A5ZYI4_9TREE|nr:uncharacterized protein I303_06428 [Kwoniella dejecticola CBS 10117]OBR82871.1 hypothetical protein I303_06428 [Kwoniella dejecticola CBS 10117]
MAPYVKVPREDNSSTAPSSSGDTEADATDTSSFMDKYSKEIYIGLAVLGVLVLGYFLWAGSTHRLSYPPFNQKRCVDCKKGISKDKTEDEDYFKNDPASSSEEAGKNGKSEGWVCKACQEKREEKMLSKEMGEDSKSSKSRSKGKVTAPGREKEGKGGKSKIASREVDSDSEEDYTSDEDEEEEEEEVIETVKRVRRVERDSPIKEEKRKSRPPPLKKRYEEESDSDDYESTDEEEEKETREREKRREQARKEKRREKD